MVAGRTDRGRAGDELATGLLRVALALRTEPGASFEDIVARVAARGGLDPAALLRYAVEHAEVLASAGASTLRAAKKKGAGP